MAFMAPIMPYVMAAGTAFSAVSQYQAGKYQAAVASQNAKIMDKRAESENFALSQDVQGRDQEAKAQIAELIAEQAASGVDIGKGTALLRRTSLQRLAGRDRQRLTESQTNTLMNNKQAAASYRAEASAAKQGAKMALAGGLLEIPSSYLSGAKMYNEYKYNAGMMI